MKSGNCSVPESSGINGLERGKSGKSDGRKGWSRLFSSFGSHSTLSIQSFKLGEEGLTFAAEDASAPGVGASEVDRLSFSTSIE